ncbi:class I SAM-dependent methyltransferase [Halorussus caseinilyticus]|uniref:Class I SAM-dependent methyltransferase n=1 Tax=Halorussus caseinilyticus TaxID=3034025 RepID=A0ABD5WFP1_9EURY|nr:class I SAM-dependent methyltransferase [Halorussus sp. DT72]
MKTFHGKPVDPREFKHRDLSNLRERVSAKRQRAREFRERANVEVEECYVCGSTETDIVREMFGYEYAQCDHCSHVYQTPRLPDDVLNEYYETDTEFASIYTDEDQIQYRLENITKPKIDFVLDHVDAEQGRWLDVGCGVGASINYLESQGWDAVGLEISDQCVSVARDVLGVELEQRPIDEYADRNPDATFDVVTFFGYLEMVPHSMRDLRLAHEMLDPDGNVGIGVMNADSMSSMVHRAIPEQAVRHSIPPVGLQQFTRESVAEAFDRVGFSPEAAWFFGLDFYELLTHLCLEVEDFQHSDLYEYLMENLNDFQQVIDDDEESDYMVFVGDRE